MATTRHTPPRRRPALHGIVIVLALLVTATACTDGDDPDADDAGEVEAPADDEPDGDAGDPGDAVALRDIAFEPAELSVAAGTTVTFTNEDTVRHTVTAGSPDDVGDAFDEELGGEGDTTTITFDEPGTIDYFCRVHPSMTATVTVG